MTNQPLELSLVTAPAAMEQLDVKASGQSSCYKQTSRIMCSYSLRMSYA